MRRESEAGLRRPCFGGSDDEGFPDIPDPGHSFETRKRSGAEVW
jgi:hypothetical protein